MPRPGKAVLAAVFFGTALAAAALDLWTKQIAARRLGQPNQSVRIEVVEGALGYRYVTNKGIIFGGFPSLGPLFFWVSLVAVPVIAGIFLRMRAPTLTMTLALAFILGGTLGNLYDRTFHEAVRDFIDAYLIRWPVFNLADSFILVGTILLMLELVMLDEKSGKRKAEEAGAAAA